MLFFWKGFLKRKQVKELMEGIKFAKTASELKRLNCIYLFAVLKYTVREIEEHLLVSKSAAAVYIQEYIDKGKTGDDRKGGNHVYFSEKQVHRMTKHLSKFTYLKVKDICVYVKGKYDIEYTISGMCKWLKEHGFVYKRPVKVPAKLDSKEQEEFINQYQLLKANIDSKKEEILFLDSTHPDHQTQSVHGWIKKGSKLAIKTTAKQMRLHYMGAIAVKKNKIINITKSYNKINGAAIVDFLSVITDKFPTKKIIHIILDNAGYHKAKEVTEYLGKQSKIQLHFLPPYSPNLNLIERLWKLMREKITYNHYYSTFTEFRTAVENFFDNLDKMQNILKNRINDNFQIIKPQFVQVLS